MAHWAELDENNIVLRVLVGDNDDLAGDEGYSWLVNNLGGTWLKTSYNGKIRYNFAQVGGIYDPLDDAFIAPVMCGHEELLLNDKKQWECSNEAHTL